MSLKERGYFQNPAIAGFLLSSNYLNLAQQLHRIWNAVKAILGKSLRNLYDEKVLQELKSLALAGLFFEKACGQDDSNIHRVSPTRT